MVTGGTGIAGGGVTGGDEEEGGVVEVEELEVTGEPPPPQALSANSVRHAKCDLSRDKRMMIPPKTSLYPF